MQDEGLVVFRHPPGDALAEADRRQDCLRGEPHRAADFQPGGLGVEEHDRGPVGADGLPGEPEDEAELPVEVRAVPEPPADARQGLEVSLGAICCRIVRLGHVHWPMFNSRHPCGDT